MKKNIALYTDTTIVGGAELQMFLLAKFLNKEEFNPILICSSHPALDSWCQNFAKENIEVIRIETNSKHSPKHYFQLKKIIKEKEIKLLHIHVWNPASGRYAFLIRKTPIIITEHDPFALNKIKNFYKKYCLKKTKKIITVSKQNKTLINELYPEQTNKTDVILNGIDIDWWKSQLLPIRINDVLKVRKNTFKCHYNTFVISTIAALHPRKGVDNLISAMPEIVAKYPNVKLAITGDGPAQKELTSLAQELNLEANIIFLGKRKKIPLLLKSSNAFVLPSLREAFGLVLLEAMVSQIPIIASNVGGIPEIIKNQENGILIEPKSPTEISKAIITLIENPELAQKFVLNGNKTIEEEYNAELMATQYQEHYNSILTQAKS